MTKLYLISLLMTSLVLSFLVSMLLSMIFVLYTVLEVIVVIDVVLLLYLLMLLLLFLLLLLHWKTKSTPTPTSSSFVEFQIGLEFDNNRKSDGNSGPLMLMPVRLQKVYQLQVRCSCQKQDTCIIQNLFPYTYIFALIQPFFCQPNP